jgi:Xaa-Pro aminopeptidase
MSCGDNTEGAISRRDMRPGCGGRSARRRRPGVIAAAGRSIWTYSGVLNLRSAVSLAQSTKSLQPAPFPPEEFADRRRKLAARLEPGAAALVAGAGAPPGLESFRQFNDFHYLSGVLEPGSYLLIAAPAATTTLYLAPRDERSASTEGDSLSSDDPATARRQTGIDAVRSVEGLAGDLAGLDRLYTVQAPAEGRFVSRGVARHAAERRAADPWANHESPEAHFVSRLRSRFPELEFRDLAPSLEEARLVKSAREIDLLRRAGRLSAIATIEAMRTTHVGVYEHQLAAVADYVFRVNGAEGQAYAPIIATGAHLWYAHWNRLTGQLADGDLVLMDCAPDLAYYTSDIGRIWPANGSFSATQRELYGYVLAYHETLLRSLRPGATSTEILAEAAAQMRAVADRTDFSKPIYREAALRMLTYDGHLSHTVGMAVHDVGEYAGRPLEPGTVFAVDPIMWVPEERVYIRVEDTIAITADGIEVFTEEAPRGIAKIEALVQGGGMLRDYPVLGRGDHE